MVCFTMGCKDESVLQTRESPVLLSGTDESTRIISEGELQDYWLAPEGKSWKDVDALYQRVVNVKEDAAGLDNFRAMAIACMIQVYGLLEDKSPEATQRTAWYASEMASLPTCSPELLYPCLQRLNGYWPESRIARVAKQGYDNSLSLFAAIPKQLPQYERRKKGMESLHTLF